MPFKTKSIPVWVWPFLWAVLLTVVFKIGDSYVVNNLLVSSDNLISALTYLSMGAMIGLTINFILCQTPLGRLIDGSYKSIRGMHKEAQKKAFISGLFGAVATLGYIWLMTILDPSIVIPLTSLAILFVAIEEIRKGKIGFTKVLPSILLVAAGIVMSTFNSSVNWSSAGGILILVFLVQNLTTAVSELAGKDGVDASDPVSFSFWRFFWLTVTGVLISIVISLVMGQFSMFIGLFVKNLSPIPVIAIAILMVFVFFANGWANKGMALKNATTKTMAMSGVIILSVFATALVALIAPTVFPAVPGDMWQWLMRVISAGLLAWGVFLLDK